VQTVIKKSASSGTHAGAPTQACHAARSAAARSAAAARRLTIRREAIRREAWHVPRKMMRRWRTARRAVHEKGSASGVVSPRQKGNPGCDLSENVSFRTPIRGPCVIPLRGISFGLLAAKPREIRPRSTCPSRRRIKCGMT
jgi:hypothetical protein